MIKTLIIIILLLLVIGLWKYPETTKEVVGMVIKKLPSVSHFPELEKKNSNSSLTESNNELSEINKSI